MHRQSGKSFYVAAPVLLLLVLAFMLPKSYANRMPDDLAAKIASYKLGMNAYTIGNRLTADQKEAAAASTAEVSYEGTYRFQDGDMFVVASREDDTVLAIYKRNDKANMVEAKMMISGLMGLFAEPTTMAHDKIIYWAYTDQGKVQEEYYNKCRQDGKELDILATVKFNSSFEVMAEDPDPEETGTIYFIISSDPLIRQYVELE